MLLNNRNDDSFPINREDTPVLSPEPDSLDVEDGSMTPWGLVQWTTQVHRGAMLAHGFANRARNSLPREDYQHFRGMLRELNLGQSTMQNFVMRAVALFKNRPLLLSKFKHFIPEEYRSIYREEVNRLNQSQASSTIMIPTAWPSIGSSGLMLDHAISIDAPQPPQILQPQTASVSMETIPVQQSSDALYIYPTTTIAPAVTTPAQRDVIVIDDNDDLDSEEDGDYHDYYSSEDEEEYEEDDVDDDDDGDDDDDDDEDDEISTNEADDRPKNVGSSNAEVQDITPSLERELDTRKDILSTFFPVTPAVTKEADGEVGDSSAALSQYIELLTEIDGRW